MMKARNFFLAILVILLWSTSAVSIVSLLQRLSPFQIAFWNLLISAFAGAVYSFTFRKIQIFGRYKTSDFLKLALITAPFFLYSVFVLTSLKISSPIEANALNYLWPLMIILLSPIILGQTVTVPIFFGGLLGFFGSLLVVSSGAISFRSSELPGYLLAIAGALSWGTYSNLLKKYQYEPVSSYFFFTSLSALGFGIILFWQKALPPVAPLTNPLLLYLGIAPGFLANILWQILMHRENVQKVALLIYLTPFLSTLWLALFLQRGIGMATFVGLSLIVIGAIIGNAVSGKGNFRAKTG